LAVKEKVPASVGVPKISPVAALRNKPEGRSPVVMLHVMRSVPVAARVAEYGVAMAPLGSVVVVMTGDSGVSSAD
jgi:hypothetical protein